MSANMTIASRTQGKSSKYQNALAAALVIACIVISALLLVLAFRGKTTTTRLPYYNQPDFTATWDESGKNVHHIAPFSFVDQDGRAVSEAVVKGKIYVANFFFTSCSSICPAMMHNLQKFNSAFGHHANVMILSHTVDPERDTVATLHRYARKINAAAAKWLLLTGNREQIYKMARQSYFADEESGYNRSSNEFLHTENCVLIDADGRIRGVYNATLELEIDKLIEDVRRLQREN